MRYYADSHLKSGFIRSATRLDCRLANIGIDWVPFTMMEESLCLTFCFSPQLTPKIDIPDRLKM